jgi:hypothetical protein
VRPLLGLHLLVGENGPEAGVGQAPSALAGLASRGPTLAGPPLDSYVYNTPILWLEGNISRRTAWGSWLSASDPWVNTAAEVFEEDQGTSALSFWEGQGEGYL